MDKIQTQKNSVGRSVEKFNKFSFSDKTLTISFTLFICLLIETILGNSGAWLSFGPIRLRMILFALCFVTAIPKAIEKFMVLVKNKFILSCAFFGIWMFVAIYIGIRNGNKIEYIVSNVTGYLTLGLAPVVILYVDTFKQKHYLDLLTNILVYTSFVLAIIVSIIHFAIPFFTPAEIMAFSKILNSISFGDISNFTANMYRIFLRSEIYFQIAIIIAISRELKKEKINWKNGFVISVLAFGMLLSLTRSFWIGAFVGLIFILYFNRANFRKILKLAILSLSFLSLLIVASMIIYRGNSIVHVAINRIESGLNVPTNEVPIPSNPDNNSNDIRAEIFDSIIEKINESVLIGSGMGTEIEANTTGGNTEYLYLDLTMKLGIVGLFLFFMMYIAIVDVFLTFRRVSHAKKQPFSEGYLSALISVMVSSYFNPYLNNPIGLVFFLCVALAVHVENDIIPKSM